MTQIIRARHVLTGQGWCYDRLLRIEEGIITAIEPIPIGTPFREAELLCPAYIDLHVHGGDGVDVMDCDPGALDRLAIFKAQQGVGAWLPTTVTAPMAEIHQALARIAQRCQSGGPERRYWVATWKGHFLRQRTVARIRRHYFRR